VLNVCNFGELKSSWQPSVDNFYCIIANALCFLKNKFYLSSPLANVAPARQFFYQLLIFSLNSKLNWPWPVHLKPM